VTTAAAPQARRLQPVSRPAADEHRAGVHAASTDHASSAWRPSALDSLEPVFDLLMACEARLGHKPVAVPRRAQSLSEWKAHLARPDPPARVELGSTSRDGTSLCVSTGCSRERKPSSPQRLETGRAYGSSRMFCFMARVCSRADDLRWPVRHWARWGAGVARMATYYLDERLSLAEGTCLFANDGSGRVARHEGFFVVAIRRKDHRECLFRFSSRQRFAARSMLERLNRSAGEAAAQP